MASAIYNDLNLPDYVYMQSGNGMSFGPLTWRNGILTRYDFPGGFFSLYDDENELPQLHPYAYITDHLGSVRMTVGGAWVRTDPLTKTYK